MLPKTPLAADYLGADTSKWSGEPRPKITAYKGADLDAYYFENGQWLHCQTGAHWRPLVGFLDRNGVEIP